MPGFQLTTPAVTLNPKRYDLHSTIRVYKLTVFAPHLMSHDTTCLHVTSTLLGGARLYREVKVLAAAAEVPAKLFDRGSGRCKSQSDEAFAWDRAASRLSEMSTVEYVEAPW